ncbi:uncharacterized protein LOC129600516 [Paramacrobiotus metropolitanus]|uniref:uncharacterized protein LOC129600516 n=1 Tax=Paramacrobiotus metropolitanus TaxID=2943436 RepID=UPI002445A1FB|nr:uncharacterized protein LOC129600516 [Paramacrobiotus metropolitanus]
MINKGLVDENPRILMRLTSFDDTTLRVTKRQLLELEGVLVYVSPDQRSSGQPAWLVPLPISDNIQAIEVTVCSSDGAAGLQPYRFVLNWEFLGAMNPDGQFGINRTALAAVPVGRLFFGDTINSVTGIPLPRILVPGTGSMFYYSVDDWRTVEQFNLTKHPIGVPICQISDQTISWLIQHAVLHDRLLVATNFGLLQLLSTRGKKKYPQMPTETVILAKCVNKIIFPPLDTQDTPYLTAITVDYEIFTAPYFSPNGSLIFTAVLSKENFYTGIQKLLPNYGRHGVIDVVEGTSRGVLALMSGDSMSMDVTDPGKTCLIFVDAATSAMTIRSCLPSFIPETDERLPFIAIDNSTRFTTRIISISRVLRSIGDLDYQLGSTGLLPHLSIVRLGHRTHAVR